MNTLLSKLPIELQDKIFLSLDFETLEKYRHIQSEYVKEITKYNNYVDAAVDKNLNSVKWLYSQNKLITKEIFNEIISISNIEIVKWIYTKHHYFHTELLELSFKSYDLEIVKYVVDGVNIPVNEMEFIYAILHEHAFDLK